MYELFIGTFITFFVVIDPLGVAPIFAVMTDGASNAFKRRMVFKATLTGASILLLFAFVGTGLLSALGISMMAFKTAGGVLLFMLALEMVFEKRTERREKKTEGLTHEPDESPTAVIETDDDFEDISVFPMGIPFIAGPGSIASIMLMMSHHEGNYTDQGIILSALTACLLLTVIILLAASKIINLMGQTVANVITRILGVILAAMATQYMFDGIKAAFFG